MVIERKLVSFAAGPDLRIIQWSRTTDGSYRHSLHARYCARMCFSHFRPVRNRMDLESGCLSHLKWSSESSISRHSAKPSHTSKDGHQICCKLNHINSGPRETIFRQFNYRRSTTLCSPDTPQRCQECPHTACRKMDKVSDLVQHLPTTFYTHLLRQYDRTAPHFSRPLSLRR